MDNKGYVELILESLLKEDVMQDKVIDAIKKRYEVGINYKADSDPKGSGYRIIQPVAYGKTSSGNLVIRAFQPFGDTKTRIPHWKMFRLDRIEKWKPMRKRKFKEPPDVQYGEQGKFNPNGDKSMAEVYLVANFHGAKNDKLMQYNQKRREERVKENPYYDLQQNIGKSINGNQMDYIRRNLDAWQKSAAAAEFRKGNSQSVYDMSRIQDFGDDENSQTVGPVRKGNTESTPMDNSKQLDYSTTLDNGPLYKQNIERQLDGDRDEETQEDNEQEQNKF